jgi:hypothetical protein
VGVSRIVNTYGECHEDTCGNSSDSCGIHKVVATTAKLFAKDVGLFKARIRKFGTTNVACVMMSQPSKVRIVKLDGATSRLHTWLWRVIFISQFVQILIKTIKLTKDMSNIFRDVTFAEKTTPAGTLHNVAEGL